MKFLTTLLLTSLPFFVLCQSDPVQHYKIYDTKNKKVVSVDDIINSMDNADVLFFGEEHNDSTCHVLEYALFKGLVQKYPGRSGSASPSS